MLRSLPVNHAAALACGPRSWNERRSLAHERTPTALERLTWCRCLVPRATADAVCAAARFPKSLLDCFTRQEWPGSPGLECVCSYWGTVDERDLLPCISEQKERERCALTSSFPIHLIRLSSFLLLPLNRLSSDPLSSIFVPSFVRSSVKKRCINKAADSCDILFLFPRSSPSFLPLPFLSSHAHASFCQRIPSFSLHSHKRACACVCVADRSIH